MTRSSNSSVSQGLRCWRQVCVSLPLLASLVVGCGAASDSLDSTDTGNPPVIRAQELRLAASSAGVVVSGEPGAVTPGAEVEVVNVTTGASETTTAASDGSFEVELTGTLDHEYSVRATLRGRSASADSGYVRNGSNEPRRPRIPPRLRRRLHPGGRHHHSALVRGHGARF